MKKRFIAVAFLLVPTIGWICFRGVTGDNKDDATVSRQGTESRALSQSGSDASLQGKTKASREPIATATHRPEQFRDFILPEIEIRGLDLDTALRKVLATYQETCAKTRQTPLPIRFDLPETHGKPLNVVLKQKSLKSAIRFLATLSRMKSTRNGLVYRFEPFPDHHESISRKISVSQDFQSKLDELAGSDSGGGDPTSPFEKTPARVLPPLRELAEALGLDLDESTRLSVAGDGYLRLDTDDASDAAAIGALASIVREEMAIQHKINTMVITGPSDFPWVPEDTVDFDDARLQLLIRAASQKKGMELMTLPAIAAKSGHQAALNIPGNQPGNAAAGDINPQQPVPGVSFHVRENALGFGHEFDFEFLARRISPDSGEVEIQSHMMDAGYSADGDSRMVVQNRPDGTKVVMFVTSTRIDPEGRPLK